MLVAPTIKQQNKHNCPKKPRRFFSFFSPDHQFLRLQSISIGEISSYGLSGKPGVEVHQVPRFSASNFLVWDNTHLKVNISPLKSGEKTPKGSRIVFQPSLTSGAMWKTSGASLEVQLAFSFMVKGLSSKRVR